MARGRLYPQSVDPGFPELPPTPTGWRRTTFGEILDVVERPLKLDPNVKYRLVTAKRSRGGITLRTELLGREILTKTQFKAAAGDFLISRRQIIHGACGVVPQHLDGAVVSNEYSTLLPRSDLLLDFLRHYSHTPYFQRTCFHSSHGVDVEKMIFKIEQWLARPVDLPPLPEQRKIAAILSSVDDAIESTQAVIEQLGVVKKAMMGELLTRGVPGQKSVLKETELGPLPAHWDLEQIGALCRVTSGGTPSRERPELWGGGIPWVKTGEINYSEIRSTEETLSARGLEESAAKLIPKGAVVMAMYGQGATRGRVATLGIDAALNQACLALIPEARLRSYFLYQVLCSRYDELREMGHEGTQKNLNAALVRAIRIPLPPLSEQDRICACVDALDARRAADEDYLASLRTLKSSLLSTLLTGELRVRPDPA